jgi:hypothetical protein
MRRSTPARMENPTFVSLLSLAPDGDEADIRASFFLSWYHGFALQKFEDFFFPAKKNRERGSGEIVPPYGTVQNCFPLYKGTPGEAGPGYPKSGTLTSSLTLKNKIEKHAKPLSPKSRRKAKKGLNRGIQILVMSSTKGYQKPR